MSGLRHLIEQTSRFEAVLTRSNFNRFCSHLDSLPLCFLRDSANEVRSKYFVLSSSFLRVVCFRLWSISFTIFLAKHKSDPHSFMVSPYLVFPTRICWKLTLSSSSPKENQDAWEGNNHPNYAWQIDSNKQWLIFSFEPTKCARCSTLRKGFTFGEDFLRTSGEWRSTLVSKLFSLNSMNEYVARNFILD